MIKRLIKEDPIRYQRSIPITCRQIVEEKFNPRHIDFWLTDEQVGQLGEMITPELIAAGVKTVDDFCMMQIKLSLHKKGEPCQKKKSKRKKMNGPNLEPK